MKYLIKVLINLILSFTIILSWIIKNLDSYIILFFFLIIKLNLQQLSKNKSYVLKFHINNNCCNNCCNCLSTRQKKII